MTPRLRAIIIIVIAIVVTFLLGMFIMSLAEAPPEGSGLEAAKGVKTQIAENESNRAEMNFSGKLLSIDRIELFAEVSGVLRNDNFKEGNRFSSGQSLVSIESSEAVHNLKAQKSSFLTQVAAMMGDLAVDYPQEKSIWGSFLDEIDVDNPLPPLPESNDKKFNRYLAGKGILSSYYSIEGAQQRLSKYYISAPFNGVVTQSNIKKGTLVRVGQKLGEFAGSGTYELVTELSLGDLKFIKKGDKVTLSSDELSGEWIGEIYRINESVEPTSQLVKVFVKVNSKELKEGIFLEGSIRGAVFENTVSVDRKLLLDNKIMVLKDDIIESRPVEVMYTGASTVFIKGIADGEVLITTSPRGLFPGQKVRQIKQVE